MEEVKEEARLIVALEIKYTTALKKVYRATKLYRSKHQMKVNNMYKRWKVILKELVDKSVYIVD